jgi:hypothetical protein
MNDKCSNILRNRSYGRSRNPIADPASAEIRLPNLLSDHAVLQRESPIHLRGWAAPGAKLTIHFHDQMTSTIADELGQWTTWLAPEHAGGPYVLDIDGEVQEGKKDLTDLMVPAAIIISFPIPLSFREYYLGFRNRGPAAALCALWLEKRCSSLVL